MYAFLIVIHVIASFVLIVVILLQAGRGGGLSESFGMSSTQTIFGTSATKFLQNATSVCAVVFLLTCLSLAALSTQRSRSLMERQRIQKVVDDLAKNPEKLKEAAESGPAQEPGPVATPQETTQPAHQDAPKPQQ